MQIHCNLEFRRLFHIRCYFYKTFYKAHDIKAKPPKARAQRYTFGWARENVALVQPKIDRTKATFSRPKRKSLFVSRFNATVGVNNIAHLFKNMNFKDHKCVRLKTEV